MDLSGLRSWGVAPGLLHGAPLALSNLYLKMLVRRASCAHIYFSRLQRRNDFDIRLLAISDDAAMRVRGEALDSSYQTFNRRSSEELEIARFATCRQKQIRIECKRSLVCAANFV